MAGGLKYSVLPRSVNKESFVCPGLANREYLAPQIRSMNNRFQSEAKHNHMTTLSPIILRHINVRQS